MASPITESLVFDRICADRIEAVASLSDGTEYRMRVRNIGAGRHEEASFRVQVSGTALALLRARLDPRLDAMPDSPETQAALAAIIEEWLRERVERRANGRPNNGRKLRTLIAEDPLVLDGRYVLN